jgi:putative spermidine/putrescine transport system ATP-binding protein
MKEDVSLKSAMSLSIVDIVKQYGSFRALDSVSVDVAPGEFLTLLGPSGSGKTTLLMAIAGFVRPDSGHIHLTGQEITRLAPYRRGIGVMFQNYALFPHKTVAENIAYPLWLRRVPKDERNKRVKESLELVQLAEYGDRTIDALSGGQRQRVALARATVFKPRILLMDEPLSALDKRLREEMQVELRNLHRKLEMTTICVTHDQREALTMSDQIAIMEKGRIVQKGAPRDVYERPVNAFVANFIGESCLLPVDIQNGKTTFRQHPILLNDPPKLEGRHNLLVRPEKLRLLGQETPDDVNIFKGKVDDLVYEGESVVFQINIEDGHSLRIRMLLNEHAAQGFTIPEMGSTVQLGLHKKNSVLVPGNAG